MRALKVVTWLLIAALLSPACNPRLGGDTSAPAPAPARAEAARLAAMSGEIKIAILVPLTGQVPTFGASTRDGALLATNEWNAKGGLLGKRIISIVEDSQCAPGPAVKAANKVIDQDKVKFIVGEVCSGASIPVSEIANSKKVIQISPTSTEPNVTVSQDGQTKRYIFRACFTDEAQGKLGARFARKTLKAETAFLMFDPSNSYTSGLAGFFEKEFVAGGGKIVGKGTYTGTDTDFSATLAKIAQARPDLVYLPDFFGVPNLVTRQAKEKDLATTFMGGDGWDSSDLDTQAADGSFFTNHFWPRDPRPEVQNFVRAYGAQFKDEKGVPQVPDALAALAYDATNLLLQAIQEAGTADDTDKVADALANISFNAVSGKISFDASHNPIKPVTVIAVRGGTFVFNSQVAP